MIADWWVLGGHPTHLYRSVYSNFDAYVTSTRTCDQEIFRTKGIGILGTYTGLWLTIDRFLERKDASTISIEIYNPHNHISFTNAVRSL